MACARFMHLPGLKVRRGCELPGRGSSFSYRMPLAIVRPRLVTKVPGGQLSHLMVHDGHCKLQGTCVSAATEAYNL